jgi:hypothetical protein
MEIKARMFAFLARAKGPIPKGPIPKGQLPAVTRHPELVSGSTGRQAEPPGGHSNLNGSGCLTVDAEINSA